MVARTIGEQRQESTVPPELPRYVRVKKAKGKTYYYFDTGAKNDVGRPILRRLPDIRSLEFGPALVAAQNGRKRRGQVRDVLTVARLIELYEKSPECRGLAASTRSNYALYMGQIARRLGHAPAADLEPSDVREIRDGMADRPGAANQWIAALGALYKWGRQRGYVSNEPTKDIVRFKKTPHEEWPVWLVERALEDSEVRLPVALLYFTAQRIGDVCRMRWNDIRDGVLSVRQEKTGKSLLIPLHGELTAILGDQPKEAITILSNGGKPFTPGALRHRLQGWVERQGVKAVPHGLRKNAINALLECGCSIAEAAAISGQTFAMVEHYARGRDQAKLASAAILRWNKTGLSQGK